VIDRATIDAAADRYSDGLGELFGRPLSEAQRLNVRAACMAVLSLEALVGVDDLLRLIDGDR
jgi:hypothetical protein